MKFFHSLVCLQNSAYTLVVWNIWGVCDAYPRFFAGACATQRQNIALTWCDTSIGRQDANTATGVIAQGIVRLDRAGTLGKKTTVLIVSQYTQFQLAVREGIP